MQSTEYRKIIRTIVKNSLHKYYPGLKLKTSLKAGENAGPDIASYIATAIHARMYGANVDGVDSPIWRDLEKAHDKPSKPNVEASELLNVLENKT